MTQNEQMSGMGVLSVGSTSAVEGGVNIAAWLAKCNLWAVLSAGSGP